jgi:ubiquinone/menaquinone biosynthesis C-methylase UbiE
MYLLLERRNEMSDIILDKPGNERLWDAAAPVYQHIGPDFTSVFAKGLIGRTAISRDAHILDVATGTGAVLFTAARRIGSSGYVTGIDISSRMIEEGKQNAIKQGLNNISLLKMDAEHLDFPDSSFDIVTCSLGIFYFTDIDAGLREMFRVCKPRGTVGITVFNKTPVPLSPGVPLFREQSSKYNVNVRAAYQGGWDPDELKALLAKQPFRSIMTYTDTFDLIYANVEEWWQNLASMATLANIMEMDKARQVRFKGEYCTKLQAMMQPDGLHMKVGAVHAIAEKSPLSKLG